MKKSVLFMSLLSIIGAINLTGCTANTNSSTSNSTFTAVELKSCGSTSVEKVITAVGNKLASLTNNKITLAQDQHGSGDATTGVTTGKNNVKYDIGFLSREIKDSEKTSLTAANKNGAMCKDAVVPIVNSANSYAATTASALTDIYKGVTTSWSSLTTDKTSNIKLYSRESGSGTRECFFEGIGYSAVKSEDKWESSVTVSSQSSNGSMMNAIKSDVDGIGYCSLDSLTNATGIKGLKYEGVTASEATVIDGTYKLSRNFNYVIRGDYSDADKNRQIAVNAFVDFLSTIEGVAAIKSAGGIVTSSNTTWASIVASKYPELA